MAEYYNTSLAKATKVELIHLNLDSDESAMAKFMKDGAFAFPGIPQAKWEKIKTFKEIAPRGVPSYKLVDATGKVIAEGAEAKSKAKELSGGTESSSETDTKS